MAKDKKGLTLGEIAKKIHDEGKAEEFIKMVEIAFGIKLPELPKEKEEEDGN